MAFVQLKLIFFVVRIYTDASAGCCDLSAINIYVICTDSVVVDCRCLKFSSSERLRVNIERATEIYAVTAAAVYSEFCSVGKIKLALP